MKHLSILKTVFLIVLISVLGGCYIIPERPNDPNFSPVAPLTPPPPHAEHGSLYHPQRGLSLFDDLKAKNVGDILSVKLMENTDASKSSSTKLGKAGSATISSPTVVGAGVKFHTPKFLPLSTASDNNLSASLSSTNSFNGSGDTTQKNKLTGEITVTVVAVLPNGDLMIRGEKWLHLTAGREYIRLTGRVRQADIREDNTILSTKVADARISYSGTGQLADTNFAGWLTRFFIHPIWPF